MATLMLVEDHHQFAEALTRLLQTQGNHQVEVSYTAESAFQYLRDTPVDLVLIDISLPGLSGIWLLKALRELQPDMPCLILSGHARIGYVERAMDAGAHGYVLKDDLPGILEGIRVALNGGVYISPALGGNDLLSSIK